MRDEGSEPVIVAEPDLMGGDGVVLVDDRQHLQLQQPLEGATGIEVVAAAGHIVDGQQDLPDGHPVRAKGLLVGRHEGALPHAGRGLLGGQVLGSTAQAEWPHPRRDGSGGHEHHRGLAVPRRDGVGEGDQPPDVQASVRAGQ